MTIIKQRYAELLSLTQLFLLREHALTDVQTVSPAVLAFFQKKMSSPAASLNKPQQQQPLKPAFPSQPMQMPTQATIIPPSPTSRPSEIHLESMPSTKSESIVSHPLSTPTQPKLPPSSALQTPTIQDKLDKPNRASKGLTLEPMGAPTNSFDQREFWKLFPNLFPEMILSESIPIDSFAKKLKNAWMNDQIIPPVIILSFYDEEKQLAFLKNLARAISLRLAPARVLSASKLEKEKGWENALNAQTLHLVIASDYGLYLQPGLMQFYREVPQQGKHYLNHIPLLLLSDLSLYLKDPQLKSLLWRAICNEFAASQHYPSVR